MLRRVPVIAATSVVALTLGLSACSGSTSTEQQTSAPQTSATGNHASSAATNSGNTTKASSPKAPDPELASKILIGQVAGVSFQQMETLPNLEDALKGSDIQFEPAECSSTGITQLDAGATGPNDTGVLMAVLLSSDASTPGKYRDYTQKCASVSGTASGAPFTQTVETQQAPAIDGATDVVAATTSSQTTVNGKEVTTKIQLIIGNVDGTTVLAQSSSTADKEPSLETTAEIFKAQAEKLKG